MNKRNYQKELEKILEDPAVHGKTLLLHSCCAPCSSYVLEYLSRYFAITVFYYNPNISPAEEYETRKAEQKRLIAAYNQEINEGKKTGYPISVLEAKYDPETFYEMAKGYEQVPEGGERCFRCYRLRLSETVKKAKEGGFSYASTTLTISPLKNAQKLNEIGEELCEGLDVSWLPGDFKKKEGYKRSIELSHEYGLYRQNYCGCIFSRGKNDEALQHFGNALE